MNTVIYRVLETQESIKKLIVADENVYQFVHHYVQDVVAMVDEAHCSNRWFTRAVRSELIRYIFGQKAKETVHSIIQSALHRNISPEVNNVPMLNQIFQLSRVLKESVLFKETSLV